VQDRVRLLRLGLQTSKGLVGLDQHQVRRWRSWYRWVTLAMLAHAFLVVAALTDHPRHPPPSGPDQVDLQRGPAPVRGTGRSARRRCRPPVALVGLATPTSSTRPHLPLPTASRLATMKITIYGWSTRLAISRHCLSGKPRGFGSKT
jgi:hypothetical protein